jgi:uncharacterized metal-binding protein
MPDAKLRGTGTLLLALGALSLAIGFLLNNVLSPPMDTGPATSIALGIGVLFVSVGAIAWVLGRLGRTTSQEGANPRLRSLGFVLLIVGIFAAVAGFIGVALTQLGTLPRDVSQAAATAGLYVAIAGTVIAAVSHRIHVHRASPPVAER